MFIRHVWWTAFLFGAIVSAQEPVNDEKQAGIAPGTPIPVPANQDKIPITSAVARLVGSNINATVVISLKSQQESPGDDVKTVSLTAPTGFTNRTEKAYRLAIHNGTVQDGDCNNPQVGALLDPDHRFGKTRCNEIGPPRESCAIGDLNGQLGGFSAAANGSISATKDAAYLPFNNGTERAILNRTIMLYEGDKRIACGTIRAQKASIQIPSDMPSAAASFSSWQTTASAMGSTVLTLFALAILY
ncbi:hypothetical protein SYNPS1DRAFT_26334 [Syncephalis pseudoplumigaleata]|uniref:Superoxide dismutase copper/zinc binding domain-containing protein n=1 Tax=Syncephalis pseudoplumigaleata TaxID=1712513 RepID=A0A4P9Z654_9FUNG|nr:hypothetical protein SYNPS1DRAFT_26334 [Syncephalis pseudoplumigaleata]|eukprot:RKP28076.1 hypothetical protein SYNPS1DRAFT_26334 [Syncephalis pseudoplumigaleata]